MVVNGHRYDPNLVARLERTPGLCCHRIDSPGVSNARLEGRRLVETPYFAFLDDDDELLPDALRLRLAVFAETGADVVVTNGYKDAGGSRQYLFQMFDQYPDNPAQALLEENWLDGPGGLYRTDSVETELFKNLPNYLEWTLLGYLLCKHHRVSRINVPTFIRHIGASNQVSQSYEYYKRVPIVLQMMENMNIHPELHGRLRRKQAAALHEISVRALEQGDKAAAWKYHLHSLAIGDGLKYLPYTRHIVLGRHRP